VSSDSSVGIATGYGLDDRMIGRLGIFLITIASTPALRPSQPPIQWVPGALSLRVKRLGREADHTPLSSAEVKGVELYIHSPILLHGMELLKTSVLLQIILPAEARSCLNCGTGFVTENSLMLNL